MVRTVADDGRDAVVGVWELAYGLAALDCPVWVPLSTFWSELDPEERLEHLTRARFVLGIAEECEGHRPAMRARWPEGLPPGAAR
jgi:hypothetical protein